MSRMGIDQPHTSLYSRWLYRNPIANGTARNSTKIFETACHYKETAKHVLLNPRYTAQLSISQLAMIIVSRKDHFINDELPEILANNLANDQGNEKFMELMCYFLSNMGKYQNIQKIIFFTLAKNNLIRVKLVNHKDASDLLKIKMLKQKDANLSKAILKKQNQKNYIDRVDMKGLFDDKIPKRKSSQFFNAKHLMQVAKKNSIYDVINFSVGILDDEKSLMFLWDAYFSCHFPTRDEGNKSSENIINYFSENRMELATVIQYPEILAALRKLYPIVDNGALPGLIADCFPSVTQEIILEILLNLNLTVSQQYNFMMNAVQKNNALDFVCRVVPKLLKHLDCENIIDIVLRLNGDPACGELLRRFLSIVTHDKEGFSDFHSFILQTMNDESYYGKQKVLITIMSSLFIELLDSCSDDSLKTCFPQAAHWIRQDAILAKSFGSYNSDKLRYYQAEFFNGCINKLQTNLNITPQIEGCLKIYVVSYVLHHDISVMEKHWKLLLDIAESCNNLAYELFCVANHQISKIAYGKLLNTQVDSKKRKSIIENLHKEYPRNERMQMASNQLKREQKAGDSSVEFLFYASQQPGVLNMDRRNLTPSPELPEIPGCS